MIPEIDQTPQRWKIIGKWLENRRIAAKLTIEDVRKRSKTGLSNAQISRIENGKGGSYVSLEVLADALDISVETLYHQWITATQLSSKEPWKIRQYIGERASIHRERKWLTAQAAVKKLIELAPSTLWISDGISTAYVWDVLLDELTLSSESERVTNAISVYTNNINVINSCIKRQDIKGLNLVPYCAPGAINWKYGSIYGHGTESWVRETCSRGINVLAVTSLDADDGPFGDDEHARYVKSIVLSTEAPLIVIAEGSKLITRKGMRANPFEWKQWFIPPRKGQLWIVSELDSEVFEILEKVKKNDKESKEEREKRVRDDYARLPDDLKREYDTAVGLWDHFQYNFITVTKDK